jgi:hypothetical protein
MKVNFTIDTNSSHVEAFEALAAADEVFANESCGKCDCEDIRYRVRDVNGDKYYEKYCPNCGAKKPFSCHKKGGTMYFDKKNKETGEYWPNNGWRKWNKDTQQEE